MFSAGGGRRRRRLQLSPLVCAERHEQADHLEESWPCRRCARSTSAYVREIAEKSLDWNALGPVVKQYRDLIAADVARDTRKLFSTDDFLRTTADDPAMERCAASSRVAARFC